MTNHPNRNPKKKHTAKVVKNTKPKPSKFYIKDAYGTDRAGNELSGLLATGGDTVALLNWKHPSGIEIHRLGKHVVTVDTIGGVYQYAEQYGKDW